MNDLEMTRPEIWLRQPQALVERKPVCTLARCNVVDQVGAFCSHFWAKYRELCSKEPWYAG